VTCNAEAPVVEQFAQQYEDKMRVVGMGTQDSFELAQSFRDRNQTLTPLMVWDESFESWDYYGVLGQPAAIIVTPTGETVGAWRGFPQEIRDYADSL